MPGALFRHRARFVQPSVLGYAPRGGILLRHRCQNCGAVFGEDDLVRKYPDIRDFFDRVSPGETVPSGECNECGCLTSQEEVESLGDPAAQFFWESGMALRKVKKENMAYTIRIWSTDHIDKFRLLSLLTAAGFTIGESSTEEKGKARRPAWANGFDCLTLIELRSIRLKESRPYCGNHAGPCDANNPHARKNKDGSKPKSKCLEGLDWIKVHNIVNDWLDSIPDSVSEVFTAGAECDGGKMFVRREGKRRMRWDYVDIYRRRGVNLRLWLSGKPGGRQAPRLPVQREAVPERLLHHGRRGRRPQMGVVGGRRQRD